MRHMRLPWVIAHRGASAVAPENTMAAFRRAVEMGAECIETDLHLSRDGRLVIVHDSTLNRTTSGDGPVKTHTFNELRELDAGRWFSEKYAGEHLPTIEELLDFAGQADLSLYLEIKGGAGYGVERAVISALRGRKESKATVVLCFDASVLDRIHQLDRLLMTGLLFESGGEDMVKEAVRVGARQIGPRGDCVTPEMIEDAHRRGLKVVTWTINEAAQMRTLAAAGVDGIMTNYPDRLVAVRDTLPPK
jgi:glycerophosphoryl diester phosphodiesterase